MKKKFSQAMYLVFLWTISSQIHHLKFNKRIIFDDDNQMFNPLFILIVPHLFTVLNDGWNMTR